MTPVLVAVVITVIVLAGVTAIILPKVLAQRPIEWRPLPGFAHAKATLPDGVDLVKVASALQQAAFAIAEHGPWKREDVMAAADASFIIVMSADSWTDAWGRKVGGMTWPDGSMQVARDLSSLCHELMHLCEMRLDKLTDDTHSTWTERGLWAADNDYRAWLKG